MSVKYSGENVVTYLLSLLNAKFKTKVDKVEGKSLSSNDYTSTEKTKLNGIAAGAQVNVIESVKLNGTPLTINSKAVDVSVPSISTNITTDATSDVKTASPKAVKSYADTKAPLSHQHPVGDITGLSIPVISTDIVTDAASDAKTASPKAVKSYVDSKISSTYKPAGSLAFASLPALSVLVLGNVYNVTDDFTTTASFVEGAGKSYVAGTNVVVIDAGAGTYKFDVLAGMIDLSPYMLIADMVEFSNAEIQTLWDNAFSS